MLKSSNTLNIYYSQKQLKHSDLEILVVNRTLEYSKLIKSCKTVLNIYFETDVPKNIRQEKNSRCQNDFIFTKIFEL